MTRTAERVIERETADDRTDAAIIERSRREPASFAAVFDRHYAAIHAYAARRLGRAHADDVAAETFLIAFDRRHRYDTTRPHAAPWLYGIASHLIARQRRAEVRQYRALARTGAPEPGDDHADRVVRRVLAQSRRPELAAALARLAGRDRDVLLLRAEAAALAGAPAPRTARPSRRRALGFALVGGAVAVAVAGGVTAGTHPWTGDTLRHTVSGAADTADVFGVSNRVALASEQNPDPALRPDQWIYLKEKVAGERKGGGQGRPKTVEQWFPAARSKHPERDRFGLRTAYPYLQTLPTEPNALLARIRHDAPALTRDDRGTFEALHLIVRDAPILPPHLRPALYRAMALIPGVRVRHGVTDAAGRHGFSLGWAEDYDRARDQAARQQAARPGHAIGVSYDTALVFDETSDRYLGEQSRMVDGHGRTETYSSAMLVTAAVDHDGQRP